jgi:hypothetical protein
VEGKLLVVYLYEGGDVQLSGFGTVPQVWRAFDARTGNLLASGKIEGNSTNGIPAGIPAVAVFADYPPSPESNRRTSGLKK